MNKDEALKMAIEALSEYTETVGHKFNAETWGDIEDKGKPAREAINACRKALEQPAQEPVATLLVNDGEPWHCTFNDEVTIKNSNGSMFDGVLPLYTHPHQWQGLTDDEIAKLNLDWFIDEGELDFARAIEQALKEKNT